MTDNSRGSLVDRAGVCKTPISGSIPHPASKRKLQILEIQRILREEAFYEKLFSSKTAIELLKDYDLGK